MVERSISFGSESAGADPSQRLRAFIEEQATGPAPPAARALSDTLVARGGDSVQAVLFYGSWLRDGDAEGVGDLYVLVDGYRAYYRRRTLALTNRILAPNVFYFELKLPERVMRAKYAVISLRDFRHGVSVRRFHSYLWGRFCQPTRLLYARDDSVRREIHEALCQAARTFVARVIPCVEATFDARELWTQGLALSYAAELRAEHRARARALYEAEASYYETLTPLLIAQAPYAVASVGNAGDRARYRASIPERARRRARVAWRVRCIQGKALSFARLVKALFTFDGGLDYAAWKIRRHSGVEMVVTSRMRRHPLLASLGMAWRVYRRGGFR
ncbi:MAG: hypothetical protein GWN84_01990 [Gammaproteobacteria bacterium]|nr:hypothetical protein [Gammaproteobacteria bacterium]NIR81931.1 hypothetical protein [Gammaproteobacteria bacterium]NIR88763.1 hypothetical protein [Gammaproteobacteria bacterium]NIU03039.1 hypothetical protein [Gammaproteobacteria bacterium]NIV50560.1 hypothetical protein [Gammaproteobacteria bacterium]